MILVDLSQVMISNVMMHLKPRQSPEEDLIRHMVISSLVSYRRKFYRDYGDLIICCDDKNYWRKNIFPEYKAHRKKDREESEIDWDELFKILHTIKAEIKEYLPYKFIQVPHAEADDVIASLCHKFGETNPQELRVEPILIVSGDKDFVQLQKYHNVAQYSPVLKKMIVTDNPERALREHIMLGDRGDGVPNFLSPDNTFTDGLRQRPLNKKKLAEWVLEHDPVTFCTKEMLRNYQRNESLVNLDKIPMDIQTQVMNAFEKSDIPPKSGVLNYLMAHRLRDLTTKLNDF